MQTLLAVQGENPQSALAIDMFCHSVRQLIGAFAAVLGGLDRLIFTAGISERAALIRGHVCYGLNHSDIVSDEAANATNSCRISTAQSTCAIEVVSTNVALLIARHSATFSAARMSQT